MEDMMGWEGELERSGIPGNTPISTGRILLKLTLKKQTMRAWTGFIWLGMWTSGKLS